LVELFTAPPLRTKESIPNGELGPPISETGPVAPDGVTLMLTVTDVPCATLIVEVPPFRCRAVLEPVKEIEDQALTRFATFTEPSPVARS
jgi:hypothetical protein